MGKVVPQQGGLQSGVRGEFSLNSKTVGFNNQCESHGAAARVVSDGCGFPARIIGVFEKDAYEKC